MQIRIADYEMIAGNFSLLSLACVIFTNLPVIPDRSPLLSPAIFSVVPSDKTMCPEVDSASENEYP